MEPFRAAIDGGSRGNPGLVAWGVAVLDDQGSVREGHAGVLGCATNNVAEYHSLIEALRLAAPAGEQSVEIRADSGNRQADRLVDLALDRAEADPANQDIRVHESA